MWTERLVKALSGLLDMATVDDVADGLEWPKDQDPPGSLP